VEFRDQEFVQDSLAFS